MTRPGTDDMVTALLTASRALVGVSAASLAAVEETMTLTQFRTLVLLSQHGDTTIVRMAERLGVNPSSAQRQVDRLVRIGMVTRAENPADRRELMVALAPAGRALVNAVTARRRQALSRIVRRMDPTDAAHLTEALLAFAAASGEPVVDDAVRLGW
jgi:DNA-binding MarR family transcriptional regulator